MVKIYLCNKCDKRIVSEMAEQFKLDMKGFGIANLCKDCFEDLLKLLKMENRQ